MGGWRGSSDGDSSGGNDNDGRGMGGSYSQETVNPVPASGFVPAMMIEWILRWRQRL